MTTKISLLVIEDEAIIAKDICDQLEGLGYSIAGTDATALGAINKANQLHPDLVLMDIQIKGDVDGIEAAREIIQTLNIPIVFLTAHADEHTLERAKKIGPYGYILKPFDEATLHTAIQVALAKYELHLALQAANEELEAYNHSISHDLKAPLRHISMFVSELKKSLGEHITSESKLFIQKTQLAIAKAISLIENLLEFSRLNRTELKISNVSLYTIAKEIADRLKELPENKNILITIDPLPDCKGDALLLEQVLENLMSNAVKFSRTVKNPSVRIGVKLDTELQPVYFVQDNGVGFNMEFAPRLFQPFRKLHGETFEGSGVGLSFVKRIILKHHGKIWVKSKEDHGSIFYFTLGKIT